MRTCQSSAANVVCVFFLTVVYSLCNVEVTPHPAVCCLHSGPQRTCYIVQYCFYKSMLLSFIQLLFNLFCHFSGLSLWDAFQLFMFNGVKPPFPVCVCTRACALVCVRARVRACQGFSKPTPGFDTRRCMGFGWGVFSLPKMCPKWQFWLFLGVKNFQPSHPAHPERHCFGGVGGGGCLLNILVWCTGRSTLEHALS